MVLANERGSAIYILFIAIAMFGAISYALLQSSRTSTAMIEGEAHKASATASTACTMAVNMAAKRLEARGCGGAVSWTVDGSSLEHPDGSCSVFHPNGGGVKPCNGLATAALCRLENLQIGESCGGAIYAGTVNGYRLYAAAADSAITTWNSGCGSGGCLPYIMSHDVDGEMNTNYLLSLTGPAAPYKAAQTCRAMGPEWYLPSRPEMLLVYNARNSGDFAGTFTTAAGSKYWTSTELTYGTRAYSRRFDNGLEDATYKSQTGVNLRCVRK